MPVIVDRPTPAQWARLVVPGLIWGMSFYFIAEGLEAFPAILITPMRIAFGIVALGLVPAARAPVPREAWPRLVLLGAVWMALPLSMFPFAEERVSSSVTGMLNGAIPLIVAVVSATFFGARPTRSQVNGVLIGFVGVVLVAVPTANDGRSSVEGIVLILVALVCYGFALNVAMPLQQAHGSLPVLLRSQMAALVLTAPLGAAGLGDVHFAWGPLVMVALLGILGTGLAYALAIANTGLLGPTRASVTTYVIPAVALGLGTIVRNESVAVLAVVGCVVALVGAYLAGRRH